MKDQNILQLDFGFETKQTEPKPKKQSKASKPDFVFDMMDPIASPIIVFNSAWKDSIPKDLLENIKLSRLISSMKGEELATLAEVIAYIMPRTLESPMTHNWANIYTWCGLQYAKAFTPNRVKQYAEIAPAELDQYERGLLKDLRRWIYRKRREALKGQLKSIKKEDQLEQPGITQTDLFNSTK